MEKLDMYIFDVQLWQCIRWHPLGHENHCFMIDCWNNSEWHPIDFLIKKRIIPYNHEKERYEIWNLIITNYDLDHYSSLPYLRTKAYIRTTNLADNLTSKDLKDNKDPHNALDHLIYLKDTYINPITVEDLPYKKYIYHLEKAELDNTFDTNNLSQIVFLEIPFQDKTWVVCIPWDIQTKWWELLLQKPHIQERLSKTHIYFASHHGRDNWYHKWIFEHCNPLCVIVSDKEKVHDTQENIVNRYANHIQYETNFKGVSRKVFTTRSDGNIILTFNNEWILINNFSIDE